MWGRIVSAAIVIAILAASAWALWPRPLEVETAAIERRDLEVAVEEEGTSRIREVFHVSVPVAGRLTRIAIHVGDSVAEGQTLASIRPAGPGLLDERSRRIAEAAVQAADAGVALAEATLAQAEAQATFAASALERTVSLAARGLVATQVEEKATLENATAQRAVEAARAGLLMRQQELESARAALIEGTGGGGPSSCCADVPAPTAGRVLAVLTESEQVVAPGTPLMDIGDPADLEVVVDVLSADAVRISPGDPATIEGWGGEPLRAEVDRVDPVAATRVSALGIEEQRARVVLRFLDGPESRARLGHGFRVIARIVVWRGDDVLAVPMGALFWRGADWAVFVVRDGVAEAQAVSIGQRNDSFAEIVAGLAVGDVVVLHPSDTLVSGQAVVPAAPLGGAPAP